VGKPSRLSIRYGKFLIATRFNSMTFPLLRVNVGRMDHPEEMDCSGLQVAGTDPAPARGTPAVLRPCAGCLWAPDAELMHQQRRGFSTFKLILRTGRHCRSMYLCCGDRHRHLFNTSMRVIHHMTDPRIGTDVARMRVNLYLDARRPARWLGRSRRG
jgi:hypothetical protein